MAIKMDNYGNVYNDELFHYGKKGMKWGKHVMAQEKYWLTGNGRNLGGDANSRMAADTSGIQWKRTVSPSGGFKPTNVRTVSTNTSGNWESLNSRNPRRHPHWYSMTDKTHSITNLSAKNYLRKNALRKDANVKYISKKTGNPVVPTSNQGIKGVNTTPQVSKSTSGNQIRANAIKNGYGGLVVGDHKFTAKNQLLFNRGTSRRIGNTMKTGIKAMQQKPDKIKKAKKKAAVGILKLASKLMKWF